MPLPKCLFPHLQGTDRRAVTDGRPPISAASGERAGEATDFNLKDMRPR
jgi:hypothetical protein